MATPSGRRNKSLIRRPIALLGRAIDDISSGLKSLAGGPLREIRSLSKFVASETSRSSMGTGILRLPWVIVLALISVLIRIAFSPIELIAGLSRGRMRQSLWASPWLLLLIVVSISCYFLVWRKSDQQQTDQLLAARQAFHEQNYDLAIDRYTPLIPTVGAMEPRDRMEYALSLIQVDRQPEAIAILQQLAPGPGQTGGYAPAHRLRAIQVARRLEQGSSAELLALLSHHLALGGEGVDSPEYSLAQAEYRIAIGRDDEAIPYLKAAAELKPEFMVKVADIEARQGNEGARQQALNEASIFFANLITERPEDSRHRIMYARILFDQRQYLQAEQVLVEGLTKYPSPLLKRSVADFFFQRFQMSADRPFAERFALIQKSLAADLNFIASHEALLLLFRQTPRDTSRAEITNYLLSELNPSAASPAESALIDFTLSNIYWLQNRMEESRSAMESAFRKNRDFAVVANNLAWLLADSENPDLNRAAELARAVVDQHPDNGHFRDTLGTVLMKQQKYDLALAEFQKALPTIKTPGLVHQKMAEIYRRLGKPSLAAEHDRKANMRAERNPAMRR